MKHFCGKCGKKFATESAYLKHLCSATGFSPGEPQRTLPKGKSVVLSEKIIYEAVKKARRKRQYNV